ETPRRRITRVFGASSRPKGGPASVLVHRGLHQYRVISGTWTPRIVCFPGKRRFDVAHPQALSAAARAGAWTQNSERLAAELLEHRLGRIRVAVGQVAELAEALSKVRDCFRALCFRRLALAGHELLTHPRLLAAGEAERAHHTLAGAAVAVEDVE